VKSGSVSSRTTESITRPPSPSTTIFSCTCPGGASKLTAPLPPDDEAEPVGEGAAGEAGEGEGDEPDEGEDDDETGAGDDGAVEAAAPGPGTRPRYSSRPSGELAVRRMRAACDPGSVRAPGTGGMASHEKVTRVCPPSPFAVPIQNRAGRPRSGSAIELSAAATAGGAPGLGGAAARAASSAVNAH
jgi:hypothetical protein